MPRPRTPHSDDPLARELLLYAASIFAMKGYHDTRTKDLGGGEYSEGLFFKKFGSKGGILKAMFDLMWGEMYERSRANTVGLDDPISELQEYLRVYVRVFRDYEDVCRVVSRNTYPSSAAQNPSIQYHEEFQGMVRMSLVEARRRGLLVEPPIPLHIIYHALRGGLENILDQFYREQKMKRRSRPSYSIDDVERHIPILLNAFLRQPRSAVVDQVREEVSRLELCISRADSHLAAFREAAAGLLCALGDGGTNSAKKKGGARGAKKRP
ncbi:MAG: TetR/AcrR family transcriptional regulator [Phycisphaerales bacterium]|nr:TetR/AcrR family transcriptional regulator [Phycisphaerales bacterium]